MKPMPETVEALRELNLQGDDNTAGALLEMGRAAKQIVPDLLGLSLTLTHEDLTFTMTARNAVFPERSALAGQDDCDPRDQTAKTTPRPARSPGEADDEDRWQSAGCATSSAGVASTLSMSILHNGVVTADVNLYAATSDAFDDRHDELAQACGAMADGAVTNADLDFMTRFEAEEAPERIRAAHLRDQAVGALMTRSDVEPDEAEDRLRQAADDAGISEARMARAILALFHGTCPPDRDVPG